MPQLEMFPLRRVRLRFPLDGKRWRHGALTRNNGWYYYVLLDYNNTEMELYRNEFEFITEEEN